MTETPDSIPSTFGPELYSERIERAQQAVREAGAAGAVIATGAEFAYFTGSWASSHERLTSLVIPAAGRATVIVVSTDMGDIRRSPIGELDVDIKQWADGQVPYALVWNALGEAPAGATIGLSSSLTADHVLRIQKRDPAERRDWVLTADLLSDLYYRKGAEEVAQLGQAAAAIDRVHAAVPELLTPGVTEKQVADKLSELILAEHDSIDFVIVGSGPNGADPHHDFSDRVLRAGEPVVVDLGGTLGAGYHSDCTRTYVVGGDSQAAPEDFRAAYDVLYRAYRAAFDAVRPGVTAQEIDSAARDIIEAAGYGDAFFHRLGHGIGLSGHEDPFIMQGNDTPLTEGMCFSIEPGIYVADKWGMRLEDIVVVEASGARSLNNGPRELC